MENKQQNYPTLETMIAYIEGRLPEKESDHFEATLKSDAGLQQDVEELRLGLNRKGGRSRIEEHSKSIATHINALDQTPTSKKPRLLYLSIAASVIIIASFFAFWQLHSKQEFQSESLMAWNEIPVTRNQFQGLEPALTKAFQFGTQQQWAAAAKAFDDVEVSYFRNEPIAFYKGRALYMAGEIEKAIAIFSKEIQNPALLEATKDKARLFRLGAYFSLSDCIKAQADLAYLIQQDRPAFREKLVFIKKSLSKKCK